MLIKIINVRHLECGFFIFLVAFMSWRQKVREVRVEFELMVLHTLTKFHLDRFILLLSPLLLIWALHFVQSQYPH
jgi:hypothetical protein